MATPPYNASGAFELLEPFKSSQGFDSSKVYTCNAIEGFPSLDIEGVDVFATFYQPYGVTDAEYRIDRINSVNIVTLLDSDLLPVLVPSSYIKSFPKSTSVSYNHLFMVYDIGVLPDGFDLTYALAAAKTVIDETIGCTSTYEVTMIPNKDQVNYVEHQRLESNRKANITYRPSLTRQLAEEKEKNEALLNRIESLESIIISLG
jgi:hypothetical protein